ncbi:MULTISPECIES: AMP-binding protein [Rhodococcus]|uniref:Putative fatty-acid--CoA ligase n=2 Tax=Rhodococcus erythropolis TaxID=1833 RepID=Q3L984_RHOE4|nr:MULTISPECIES: AMP-binding protein [Rhodococcus]EQM29830.1 hypothetical protein N601_30780 [Rhodococcus erythropolis DN1]MBW0282381.1 hypothetical protein [Rhodococcus sp. FH8]MBW0288652.1 hypothetical protein [Rhodococcus sp. MH15]MCD2136257.1 AMP-binding protein [Rhodococcus qingshengii]MCJ0901618.1 AMP-binding protein [Rhodococcus sp. ARC_M13]
MTSICQWAHALRACGVAGDERVATLMCNNQEHVEAYCAVASMGAVLHTLNPRLSAEQLAYIGNHAEDRGIIVEGSLVPLFPIRQTEVRRSHDDHCDH